HLLRARAGALPALPLQRLSPAELLGLVAGLRSLLRALQRVRFPRQLELVLGPADLDRVRALLLLRRAHGLPAAFPAVGGESLALLVVGRLAPLGRPVGRRSAPLQAGAGAGRVHAAVAGWNDVEEWPDAARVRATGRPPAGEHARRQASRLARARPRR